MSPGATPRWRRWLGRGALGFLGLLVIAQAIRPAPTNPPGDSGLLASADAPTRAVLQRACMDCHSNQTVWPWYSEVAPISWLLVSDVNEGREELNLSAWSGYPAEKQRKLLHDVCEESREGEMPPLQYTLVHRDAKLSAHDVEAICAWTQQVQVGARL